MAFLNVLFPKDISYGSQGGPEYNTTVVVTKGGQEQRNINWQFPRMKYNITYGLRHEADLEEVLYLFHIANGRANTFRYFDWSDYKTSKFGSVNTELDCAIGTNYGAQATHQLKKTYVFGGIEYSRNILLPVQGTVKVAINYSGTPVPLVETTDYTIDYTTGILTLVDVVNDKGVITAGFDFHVKVRFNSDMLNVKYDTFLTGSTDIELVEVK